MKKTKILILAKQIDGGTGTYTESLLSLPQTTMTNKYSIMSLALETPSHRIINKNILTLHQQDTYAQIYTVSLKNLLNICKEVVWLLKQIKKSQPDILLSVGFHSNILALITQAFHNKPVIITTHIDLHQTIKDKSSYFLKNLLYFTTKHLYNKADRHICVSKQLSLSMHKRFLLSKVPTTIHHGVFANKSLKRLKNKFDFVTIMRLTNQKDHSNLLKAFNIVIKKFPKTKLIIIGNGPMKDEIKKQITEFNLNKNVKMLGWVKSINKYLLQSNAFIFSSKREGFGYAILEAMSYGLPVISTDTNFGPREIIGDNKYGLLCEASNHQQLASEMIKLSTNKKLVSHYSKMSIKRSQYFSIKKMHNKYIELFESITKIDKS